MPVIPGVITPVASLATTGRIMFRDWDDFVECVRFVSTPNLFSWLSGELLDDWIASWKFGIWLATGVIPGTAVGWWPQ